MAHNVAIAAPFAAPSAYDSVTETFLARLKQKGSDYPMPSIGTDEKLIVGAPHGYAAITCARPAVMAQVGVDTANAVCGMRHAKRDAVPMPCANSARPAAMSAPNFKAGILTRC